MSAMSVASSYKCASGSQYRSVEYHDGQVVRIQETRRRQPSKESSSTPERRAHSRYIKTAKRPETEVPTLLEGQGVSYNPKRTRPQSNEYSHVTTKPKAKPVLVQASTSTKVRKSKVKVNSAPMSSTLPTPPPTPRMGRLATPELSDLEDSPFCDCCQDINVVKYCASCGIELGRC